MSMLQLGLIGIVGVLLALQLKLIKPEFSVYIGLAIGLLIFFGMTEKLAELVNAIHEILQMVDLSQSYLGLLFKMLGITYVAEFSSAICKDAGYQTIASQIEIFAKLTILTMSLPIVLALMRTIQEFLR